MEGLYRACMQRTFTATLLQLRSHLPEASMLVSLDKRCHQYLMQLLRPQPQKTIAWINTCRGTAGIFPGFMHVEFSVRLSKTPRNNHTTFSNEGTTPERVRQLISNRPRLTRQKSKQW